jgi:hypothetical protein
VSYDGSIVALRVVLLVAVLLAGTAVSGFERMMGLPLINEAMLLGQSRSESVRARFHQPYRLEVGRPPIDYLDLVTPFRRVVLLAEERGQLGTGLSQREAIAGLGDQAGEVQVRVEMTFHPLNVFVGVPEYTVELVAGSAAASAARVTPRNVDRIPRFGARTQTGPSSSPPGGRPIKPGLSQPLAGGTILAAFPIDALNATGVYDVVVSENGKELARARVDFGGLR